MLKRIPNHASLALTVINRNKLLIEINFYANRTFFNKFLTLHPVNENYVACVCSKSNHRCVLQCLLKGNASEFRLNVEVSSDAASTAARRRKLYGNSFYEEINLLRCHSTAYISLPIIWRDSNATRRQTRQQRRHIKLVPVPWHMTVAVLRQVVMEPPSGCDAARTDNVKYIVVGCQLSHRQKLCKLDDIWKGKCSHNLEINSL